MPITKLQPEMIESVGNLTITGLNLTANANIAGATITNLVSNGVVPTTNYLTFQSAVSDAAPTGKTILVCSNITCSANTTVPSNVALLFVNNGVIHTAPAAPGSAVVTISGPILAPATRIFSNSAYIYFPSTNGHVVEVLPQWWGALGNYNGSTGNDDTAAFNRALLCRVNPNQVGNANASITHSNTIRVLPGNYLITSTININYDATQFWGSGARTSQFWFVPTAHDLACFDLRSYKGITLGKGQLFSGSMKDLTIVSTETSFRKKGIEFWNLGSYDFDTITIRGTAVIGNSYGQLFGDLTHQSVGMQSHGRDAIMVRNLFLQADYPLIFDLNPTADLTQVEDLDQTNWHNLYLQPYGTRVSNIGHPSITVVDGAKLSQLSFTGVQAWVGGSYGLYWYDTTSQGASFAISFENVRIEQSADANSHMFYIKANSGINGLHFQNIYGGATGLLQTPSLLEPQSGYYLRGHDNEIGSSIKAIRGVTWVNCVYTGNNLMNVNSSCIDVSASTQEVTSVGCMWQAGSQVKANGQLTVFRSPQNPRTASNTLGPNFFWSRANNASAKYTIGANVALTGEGFSLLSNTETVIGQRTTVGFLTVHSGQGFSALFDLQGNNNKVIKLLDSRGSFSNANGTSANVNVYYSSNNEANSVFAGSPANTGAYFIENRIAANLNFRMLLTGSFDNINGAP